MYGHDPNNPEAHFVMVECGRYKDSHAVTDLIGAPLGYVGSDKGILRDGVRDKYPCVIVFDEAERMNVGIWDSLLTMFNDGVFRDNEGARYTLKDCVVVLTSNKGIEEAEDYRNNKLKGEHAKADALVADAHQRLENKAVKAKSGPREILSSDEFWSNEDYRENYKAILLSRAREHFGPALYNRIDEKIGFNGLREVDYVQIAAKAVNELIAHLEARTGVRLWYKKGEVEEVPQAIAGVIRSQADPSARDINRFVRKYILDDAFAPLKLKEIEEKKPLAPAYEIQPKMTAGKKENQVLDHFELVEAEPLQGQP
jgi:ATP-dependent Clp protease ATP-binding subunit ClpA